MEKVTQRRKQENLSVENIHENKKEFDFDEFEFKSIEDFIEYNMHVRKFNRTCSSEKNKMNIKVPGEEFHKKVKVRFQRFDQPDNVLKVSLRNSEIEWTGQLKPGGEYELPIPVVKFLNKLATPIFDEVEVKDKGNVKTETKQVGERNRFSCNVIDF